MRRTVNGRLMEHRWPAYNAQGPNRSVRVNLSVDDHLAGNPRRSRDGGIHRIF
ncbi:MAG TPA: hypothetical protein VHE33_02835 [Acidobacteriaceae bacterium]|nr:hypothetical protein [Acidobacteriaceae bacterium]